MFVTVATPIANQLAAQTAPLAFDVVSIKENKAVSDDGVMLARQGRFTVTNLPVVSIIRYAFQLRDYQLINAPDWTSTTRYDVIATYPNGTGALTDQQVGRMVQTLLADRFGLQVHRETRQLPVYELTLARRDGTLGPQLVAAAIDCDGPVPPSTGRGGFSPCQGFQNRSFMQGRGATLDGLATALHAMVRQKVLNRTGLTGKYDFTARWGDARGPAEGATVEEIGAMMTALQDQLGLKLESTRAPEEVVVVDAARRPTAD